MNDCYMARTPESPWTKIDKLQEKIYKWHEEEFQKKEQEAAEIAAKGKAKRTAARREAHQLRIDSIREATTPVAPDQKAALRETAEWASARKNRKITAQQAARRKAVYWDLATGEAAKWRAANRKATKRRKRKELESERSLSPQS